MQIAETARDAIDGLANSEGRSTKHLLIGLGITAGAVLASALIARANAPTEDHPDIRRAYDKLDDTPLAPPKSAFAVIWPPLFLALTLSGLRVWNAPASPARTQALTLWGVVQALNATWMAIGPKHLGGQLATAIASLGTSAAYAWRARQVDQPAANMVAPYVGWVAFANVLTGDLWRRNRDRPTIH
ncbi:TspO/MBR family protein [Caulobacter mirabilis]|uniref:TspO protein n=1 Tax=Caulobacter mirabilis TaxID=69666 RepID=A0A2D2ATW4_9CAUL|nr:TspO/MBR family protein [Caulobacter mirabilis]ATQ41436.1 TspO protein [Caulobacter mirabilis]